MWIPRITKELNDEEGDALALMFTSLRHQVRNRLFINYYSLKIIINYFKLIQLTSNSTPKVASAQ
jgi:hypothetical protein